MPDPFGSPTRSLAQVYIEHPLITGSVHGDTAMNKTDKSPSLPSRSLQETQKADNHRHDRMSTTVSAQKRKVPMRGQRWGLSDKGTLGQKPC